MPSGRGILKNIVVLWVKYQAIKLTKGIRTASEFSVGAEVGGLNMCLHSRLGTHKNVRCACLCESVYDTIISQILQ